MLISGAIILEVWKTSNFIDQPLPQIFNWVILIARFALISHFIEAIIAGLAAKSQENPLTSAVYTFFVGTVGLAEATRFHQRNRFAGFSQGLFR